MDLLGGLINYEQYTSCILKVMVCEFIDFVFIFCIQVMQGNLIIYSFDIFSSNNEVHSKKV